MTSQFWAMVSLVVVLLLLARTLYWRVPQGMGYIRSGLGKQRVFLEGGGLVIPGMHRIAGMQLDNFTLDVCATRQQSLLTADPLRVDIELQLLARIRSDAEMVLIAKSVFGGEADKVNNFLEQRCIVAMQAVAGGLELERLLRTTLDFENDVHKLLDEELKRFGLEVVLVSVTEIKQTSQLDYQRGGSVDARALSVLESMRTDSLRKIHANVKSAELQMKKLDFEAAVKKLEWDEQYAVARLEHQRQTAAIEARLTQEIREIEVARQLAAEMVEQDAARMRLQYQAA